MKRMTARWIAYGFTLILIGGGSAAGQSLVQSPYVGARNIAFGNSDIGGIHDMSSMYENPAAIAFLENPSVVLNHIQGEDNEMQENIAFPLLYSRYQMLAFGAEFYSLGELTTSKYTKRYAVGYDFVFASKINPTMSLGGRVSLRRGFVAHMTNATAASYAFGFEYSPDRENSYGLTFGGLGTGIGFPTGYTVVTPIQTVLPRVLQVGATLRLPGEQTLQPVDVVLALAAEKVFGTSGVDYMGGIEYYPVHFLALRFGYVSGPVMSGGRYGLGLRVGAFHLDAAVYPLKEGGSAVLFKQISVSMEF